MHKRLLLCLFCGLFILSLTACGEPDAQTALLPILPTPTLPARPTTAVTPVGSRTDFLVVAVDVPYEPFTSFNAFGEVQGVFADLLAVIATNAGLDYEFVVTPYEGALSGLGKDFNAVMSTATLPATPLPGITYTLPFLEIGQVMLVLADNRTLQTPQDLQPGTAVGVQAFSHGYEAARTLLGLSEADIFVYPDTLQVVKALIDESVTAVILDHFSATQFALTYPEQLKIVGGLESDAWVSRQSYTLALAADNPVLLERINEAIAQMQRNTAVTATLQSWLVPDVQNIDVGESRVGTPTNELVIGIAGQLHDLDPAGPPDLISWEIKTNVMSGLYRFTADNQLLPTLAADAPTISPDGLEYTIRLRPDLHFPDGRTLTADDVKWSIDRAAVAGTGSFLINAYLKDSNDDGFADADAVQVLDSLTVKFTLQAPTGFFPSLLAIPPYYPVSRDCYADVFDPQSICGGIGPYTIVSWEAGERLRLQANPNWPGSAPVFSHIQIRFYGDAVALRRSLIEFQSIDIAWTGLPYNDYASLRDQDIDGDGTADLIGWEGPAIFKSYLIFEQANPPWDNIKVRQAAAYAIDREALARDVFAGSRLPLYSPAPDQIPGHLPTLPQRDLAQARSLLLEAGYSQSVPLPITIWYLNDGRYSPQEEAYANALKAQLEETGVFQVTLSGAPWEIFQTQIFSCSYPAYLLGWPSPGSPTSYPDIASWTDFFVQNTDRVFCSNYESAEMTRLLTAANAATDPATRLSLYGQIQTLWAKELPTLDLTQEPRHLLSLAKISGVSQDAFGLLHYDTLNKTTP